MPAIARIIEGWSGKAWASLSLADGNPDDRGEMQVRAEGLPKRMRTKAWPLARRLRWPAAMAALCLCAALAPSAAPAQDAPAPRQSLDDAWWTGPMLANSAATLPQGHFLVEPYLYDVSSHGVDGYGSLTYMLYGVTDRLTVGLVPVFGYNRVDGGPDSRGIGAGDLSVQAQYRLHQFREGSWLPTVSLQLQETLPTGKYDRLGRRPADGLGGGAHATTLQLNTQTYFWLPSGRILRMRFNVAQTWSRHADVRGVSVYGTPEGFRGRARPGDSFYANAAWEYSLTRRWVLALDLAWRRNASTRVDGVLPDPDAAMPPRTLRARSGRSDAYSIAPAVEYNFSANLGVLFGTRVITGHRAPTTITPAVALNYVH